MTALKRPPGFVFTLEDAIDSHGGHQRMYEHFARQGMRGKDAFIEILYRDVDEAVERLQAKAPSFADMDEDGHSREIVSFLAGRFYDAWSEPFQRGHVDIHIDNKLLGLKWNGEAKIHYGYGNAIEGMRQLLTRYATGTHEHGGFFLYVRRKKAALITTKWRKKLVADTAEDSCWTIGSADDPVPLRFQSTHRHSALTNYVVRHHIVNMYFKPMDKSGRESADEGNDDGVDEDENDLT